MNSYLASQLSPQKVRPSSGILYFSLCFFFVLIFTLQTQAQAPKYTLSGVVLDAESNEALQLVPVSIDSLKIGVITNLDGQFVFSLPPGKYTLNVKAIGYLDFFQTVEIVDKNIENLVFKLESKSYVLPQTVVIKPKENPALRIIRNAIKNKKYNRPDEKVKSYECDAYSKTTVTVNNIPREKLNNFFLKPAKGFLLGHANDSAVIDTNSRFKLGIYIHEAISRIYFKQPGFKKEIIKAVQSTGFETNETNFISGLLRNVNIYDNTIDIMERDFVSPIASGALLSYRYLLFDTLYTPAGDSIFGIKIFPRNKYERLFKGVIYIESANWAVKKVDLTMNESPNVNFIENIRIRQEFEQYEEFWLPKVQDVEVDFKNQDEKLGLIGRTVNFFDNYILNQPYPDKHYAGEIMTVEEDATKKDSTYWKNNRLSSLEKSDQIAYDFINELKGMTLWKVITTMMEFVSTGKKRIGKVDIGPYLRVISWNPIEGARLQLGVYSNANYFPKHWYFGTHLAYGFKDKKWKYDIEVRYKLRYSPRIEIGISRTDEVEQTGFRNYELDGTGALNSSLMRVPLYKLNYYVDNTLRLKADLTRGLSANFFIKNKRLTFQPEFPFAYRLRDGAVKYNQYCFTEVGASFRVTFKENYTLQKGERIYTGSKYPALYFDFNLGLKGLLGSDFGYQAVTFTITDKMKSGKLGWLNYTLTLGQIFGTLPFPSLYVFKGSQSYIMDPNGYYIEALTSLVGSRNRSALYDGVGFNLMYFYEFIADRYLVFAADYHAEGFLFNRVPGLKWLMAKLKWKEVFTYRLAYGELSAANIAMNDMRQFVPTDVLNHEKFIEVKAPDKAPYMEAGFGIENILKFMRVDFIWRLNYLNPQAPERLRNFYYNFGVRFYVGIAL